MEICPTGDSLSSAEQEVDVPSKNLLEVARKHWFWIALVLVAFLGYQIGKDRALTENREASAARGSG